MQSESVEKKNPSVKQWDWGRDEVVEAPLHNLHQVPKGSGVTGVNGVNETYVVSSVGTVGEHAWSLNLSQLPG